MRFHLSPAICLLASLATVGARPVSAQDQTGTQLPAIAQPAARPAIRYRAV
jgi:hypothetical protein